MSRNTEVPKTLKQIAAPVELELQQFRSFFRSTMKSDSLLLDVVIRYILRRKGKQARPMLVLLSSLATGGISRRSYVGAAMVELLHTATLVHDDVVDEADERRGMPSINAVWKNKIAVLVGDYLLSRGLLVAIEHREHGFLDITSTAVQRMSEGELLQIRKSKKLDITEAEYFRIISDKTASLIGTCCELGAAAATDDPTLRQALRQYGEHVGIAFQIRDDLFDYGFGAGTGKPIGNDVQESKMTLPLIHALQKSSRRDARRILKLVRGSKKTSNSDQRIVDFVGDRGGFNYAREVAENHRDKAIKFLEPLPNGTAKDSLIGFAHFAVERKA